MICFQQHSYSLCLLGLVHVVTCRLICLCENLKMITTGVHQNHEIIRCKSEHWCRLRKMQLPAFVVKSFQFFMLVFTRFFQIYAAHAKNNSNTLLVWVGMNASGVHKNLKQRICWGIDRRIRKWEIMMIMGTCECWMAFWWDWGHVLGFALIPGVCSQTASCHNLIILTFPACPLVFLLCLLLK